LRERLNTEYSFSFAADERLSSVSYKSTGVGSKVVGAAVKTLAVVVGAAARVSSVAVGGVGGLGARAFKADDHGTEKRKVEVVDGAPAPEDVRDAWAETESGARAEKHRSDYRNLATIATNDLLTLNQQVLQGQQIPPKLPNSFGASANSMTLRRPHWVRSTRLKACSRHGAVQV